jgi:hypothetical protein
MNETKIFEAGYDVRNQVRREESSAGVLTTLKAECTPGRAYYQEQSTVTMPG